MHMEVVPFSISSTNEHSLTHTFIGCPIIIINTNSSIVLRDCQKELHNIGGAHRYQSLMQPERNF